MKKKYFFLIFLTLNVYSQNINVNNDFNYQNIRISVLSQNINCNSSPINANTQSKKI